MASHDRKTSALPTSAGLSNVDYIVVVGTVNTTPNTYIITTTAFFSNVNVPIVSKSNNAVSTANLVLRSFSTPANSTANCVAGQCWFDTNYAYFAVGNNSIKRVALVAY